MRQCGTCSACCRWPEIAALAKPQGEPCRHLEPCGYGCSIYRFRPRQCSEYLCAWIEGSGAVDDQPDQCGVLIDRRETQFGLLPVARELVPGAFATREGRGAMYRISRSLEQVCLMVSNEDSELVVGLIAPGHVRDAFLAEFPDVVIKPDGSLKRKVAAS